MKKILLLMITFFTILSCEKSKDQSSKFPQSAQDSAVAIIDTISPNLTVEEILKEQEELVKESAEIVDRFTRTKIGNGYIYKLYCEEERSGIVNFTDIEIFKNKKLLQKIKVDSAFVFHKEEISFEISEDVNFDNENDIKLVNWVGMHGSDIKFNFYLFDKKMGKYTNTAFLSDINAPEIDKKNKRIIESGTIGPSSSYEHIYKWEKGKLIIVSGYDTNPMNNEVEKF